jgi:hypothetical protein
MNIKNMGAIMVASLLAAGGGAAEPDVSFRVLDWRLPQADKISLSKFMGFRWIDFNMRTGVWTITATGGEQWYMRSSEEFVMAIVRQASEYGYRCSMGMAPRAEGWDASCERDGKSVTGKHVFQSTALLDVVLSLPEARP